jgi:hypothetical protein
MEPFAEINNKNKKLQKEALWNNYIFMGSLSMPDEMQSKILNTRS